MSLLNVAGGNAAFQKQQKPQNAVSGSSGEKLDESSQFSERKGCAEDVIGIWKCWPLLLRLLPWKAKKKYT